MRPFTFCILFWKKNEISPRDIYFFTSFADRRKNKNMLIKGKSYLKINFFIYLREDDSVFYKIKV